MDLLERKQKEQEEKLGALSKTVTELDATRQSLMLEAATKSEQLAQINKEKDYLSKQTENFKTAFDLNKKASEDAVLKAKNLREELDLLERKHKDQEEKLSVVSKTVSELDTRKKSLLVEVATKSEQLNRINDKTEESRKTLQKLGAEVSALETLKANFDRLKREFEKI